jgi:hypothetical protein
MLPSVHTLHARTRIGPSIWYLAERGAVEVAAAAEALDEPRGRPAIRPHKQVERAASKAVAVVHGRTGAQEGGDVIPLLHCEGMVERVLAEVVGGAYVGAGVQQAPRCVAGG